MANDNSLQRFIKAQEKDYPAALYEVKSGRKRSHWMWYIFPQIQGLGFSSTSQLYAIKGLKEAEAYLRHEVLGKRLSQISNALLQIKTNNATEVFGSPDDMKLRSSMTLFAAVPGSDAVFQRVLDKFFQGRPDVQTLTLLNR
jgi:uncharacterized protein (DUF1810 family)